MLYASFFLLNISKLLRTPLLKNISEQLVLYKKYSKLFLNPYFELCKLSQSKISLQKKFKSFPWTSVALLTNLNTDWLMLVLWFHSFLQLRQQYLLHIVHQCIVPSSQGNQYLCHMYIQIWIHNIYLICIST